jgi:hypothetical protein
MSDYEFAKELEPYQIEKLIEIVRNFHWMARRYADGRMSYVTGLFNDHVRALQQMGVELNPTGDETVWAKDGMGRAFDGLPVDGQLELSFKEKEDRNARTIQGIQSKLMGWE